MPQNGVRKKDSIKPVAKPYLTGKPWNQNSVRRALRIFGIMAAFAFAWLIVGSALNMESTVLRVLLNGALILVLLAVMFNQGASDGDTDVSFGEICYMQKKEGRKVSPDDEARCYHKLHGLLAGLAGVLPYLVVAVIYAVTAVKQVYSLQTLPAWVSAYSGIEGVGDALVYYQREVAVTAADIMRIIVRVLCLPYVNMFAYSGADLMLLVDRLSPVFMLLPAVAYWIGCLQGPRSRALVHGSIQFSQRRKERKRLREQKKRNARKPENREIV